MAETKFVGNLLEYLLDQLVGKSITYDAPAGGYLSLYDQDGTPIPKMHTITGTINKADYRTQPYQNDQKEAVITFLSGAKLTGIVLNNPTMTELEINNSNPYGLDFYGINDDGTPTTGDFEVIDNMSPESPFTIEGGESLEGLYVFNRGGTSDDTFNTKITASLVTDQVTPAGGQIIFNPDIFGNDFTFQVLIPEGTSAGTYDFQFQFEGGGSTQTPTTLQVIVPA